MAGDLLLVHRRSPLSSLIAWGQRRQEPRYSWATHAGILVSESAVAEALGHGVVLSSLSKYDCVPHVIVPLDAPDEVRGRVVKFALHAVGRRYGYLEIASLGLYLLTRTKLRFCKDNQLICSAMAAEAWSRNVIFPDEPLWMMPEDLAAFTETEAPHG